MDLLFLTWYSVHITDDKVAFLDLGLCRARRLFPKPLADGRNVFIGVYNVATCRLGSQVGCPDTSIVSTLQ